MTKKLLAGFGIFFLVGLMASTTINGVRIVAGDLTVQGIATLANGAVLGSPASIVLPSGATGTTQAALDASTKIATTAYVNHCGGAAGTAFFNANGGSIAGLVTCGIITNVTRSSTGIYSVTMTSPTTNVLLSFNSSDNNTGQAFCQGPAGSTATALPNPFTVSCVRLTGGGAPAQMDPSIVMIIALGYN